MFGSLPVQRATLPARDGKAIADARSWGYQLQNVRLRSLSEGADVLVVDYSRDGSDRRVLRPDEIERLRQRADGSRRIVLAYLSIGEAENYRYYWRQSWTPSDPAWLGPENTEWRGNFAVRYWMQGWKDFVIRPHLTMLGRLLEGVHPQQRPYLDRIIDAGFDGVYLDRVDAFDIWAKENPRAQLDMIAFVEEIAGYAHRRKKGFLVVAQNGEELLSSAAYRHAIDAVAKEDLLYGINGDETPNPAEDIALLDRAPRSTEGSGQARIRGGVPRRSRQARRSPAAAGAARLHLPLRRSRSASIAGIAATATFITGSPPRRWKAPLFGLARDMRIGEIQPMREFSETRSGASTGRPGARGPAGGSPRGGAVGSVECSER